MYACLVYKKEEKRQERKAEIYTRDPVARQVFSGSHKHTAGARAPQPRRIVT